MRAPAMKEPADGETAPDEQAGRGSSLPVLLVLAILGVFFVWFRESGLIWRSDAPTLFAPYYTLVADFARAGELLVWNPWSNCGAPDAAYVEMGSFSPLTILHGLATGGGPTGFLLYELTIWGIGGVGMALFGRHLRAPAWATAAVSVAFLFGGFYLGHLVHTSWAHAFTFLPLLLWRLDVALDTRRWWPAVEGGALYGLSALAGHPALVILNGLFIGVWVLGRWLASTGEGKALPAPDIPPAAARARRPSFRGLVRLGVTMAIFLTTAIVVLSPAYLFFFAESTGFSDRAGGLGRAYAISNHALPPGALAAIASPYLSVLKNYDPELWVGTLPQLTLSYIGALVPALAITALLLRPRDRFRWWVALIALLFLTSAVGDALPVRGWLYDLCPPTRYFRHSAVMRAYFLVALCVLALFATRSARGSKSERRRFWKTLALTSIATSLAATIAYLVTIGSVADRGPGIGRAHFHFFLAWTAVPCLALVGWHRPRLRRAVPVAVVLIALVDGALAFVVTDRIIYSDQEGFAGWDFQYEHRDRSLDLMTEGLGRRRLPATAPLTAGNIIGKVSLLENYNQLANRFHTRNTVTPLETSWCDEEVLHSAVSGSPKRIWFAREVATTAASDACFREFVERARERGTMPLVVQEREEMLSPLPLGAAGPDDDAHRAAIAALPSAERIDAELVDYTPTTLDLSVTCPDDGWLLVTDRWARGWEALVDGEAEPIRGGNFLFRALPVTAGEHLVEFTYRPAGQPWLTWLSWITLGGVIIGSVRGGLIRRAKRSA